MSHGIRLWWLRRINDACILPVIGSWVEWYANYAPVHGFGVTANLVYAAMAMQVIVTMLGIVFYGPVVFVAALGN